jgi:GxxExxY protein
MSINTYQEQKNLLTIIKVTCDKILLKNGPFLKEGIYQEILFHELSSAGLIPKREVVFSSYFKDSSNVKTLIGNGHSLRTDIEIPDRNCILELKSSGNETKEENIWQLRNYLEQREDMIYGIVINFVSKFGRRDNNLPFVQYDLLCKTNEYIVVNYQRINKYYHLGPLYSDKYPMKEEIFIKDE